MTGTAAVLGDDLAPQRIDPCHAAKSSSVIESADRAR
jgi:hypothetical protein